MYRAASKSAEAPATRRLWLDLLPTIPASSHIFIRTFLPTATATYHGAFSSLGTTSSSKKGPSLRHQVKACLYICPIKRRDNDAQQLC